VPATKTQRIKGTVGFIATVDGRPAVYENGTLYIAGAYHPATLFPSYQTAQRAITTAVAYGAKRSCDWNRTDYSVVRITTNPHE